MPTETQGLETAPVILLQASPLPQEPPLQSQGMPFLLAIKRTDQGLGWAGRFPPEKARHQQGHCWKVERAALDLKFSEL